MVFSIFDLYKGPFVFCANIAQDEKLFLSCTDSWNKIPEINISVQSFEKNKYWK